MGAEDLIRMSMAELALFLGAPTLGLCGLLFSESMLGFALRLVKQAKLPR